MKPVTSIQDALNLVESFEGSPSEFRLPISDNLNDPIGVNMAIITDRILIHTCIQDDIFVGCGHGGESHG